MELVPNDHQNVGYLANTLRLRLRTAKKPLPKVAKEAARLYSQAMDLGSKDMEVKKGTHIEHPSFSCCSPCSPVFCF
jgi:hypothetical protein